MAKYLQNSSDIEIEEVTGTENIKFNFANNNSIDTKIGNLSNLQTSDKTNVVSAINDCIDSGNYSTSEIKTNKTWTNNKPIYRKVIETGAIANTSKSVAHGISDLGIVVSIYGIAITSSNAYFTIPRIVTTALNQQIGLSADATNVTIDAGSVASFANSFIVIEYTKTTD